MSAHIEIASDIDSDSDSGSYSESESVKRPKLNKLPSLKEGQEYLLYTSDDNGEIRDCFLTKDEKLANGVAYPPINDDGYPDITMALDLLDNGTSAEQEKYAQVARYIDPDEVAAYTADHWVVVVRFDSWC